MLRAHLAADSYPSIRVLPYLQRNFDDLHIGSQGHKFENSGDMLCVSKGKRRKYQPMNPREFSVFDLVPIPEPRTEEPGARRVWMQGAATQE
jgi:hypothetical protein